MSGLVTVGCSNRITDPDTSTSTTLSYRLVASYSHNPSAFTQGLEFIGSSLVESTGGSVAQGSNYQENSNVRLYDSPSGTVLAESFLDSNFFGEGITIFGGTLYQLTWTSRKVFTYPITFTSLGERSESYTLEFASEGWGLTHDTQYLYMSDGSSTLYIVDPNTFALIDQITVKQNGTELSNLNELEYVNGYIYANVWKAKSIVRIDISTGNVVGELDLSDLDIYEQDLTTEQVLNGIAYRSASSTFFITGKQWDTLYEIEIP